jgi:hypothetical protein
MHWTSLKVFKFSGFEVFMFWSFEDCLELKPANPALPYPLILKPVLTSKNLGFQVVEFCMIVWS